MARTNGGINKRARYKILECIQQKKASKKDIIDRYGTSYVKLNLGELTEFLGRKNKSAISKILKNMISNRVILRIDLQTKAKGSRFKEHAYAIASCLEGKEISEITCRELYPTRNYTALKALEIFNQETHQPPKRMGRRTFVRIARILKERFDNSLDKFRTWCRWIYKTATKGTYTLLRSAKAISIFVNSRFERIFSKYQGSFVDFLEECSYNSKQRVLQNTQQKMAMQIRNVDANAMDYKMLPQGQLEFWANSSSACVVLEEVKDGVKYFKKFDKTLLEKEYLRRKQYSSQASSNTRNDTYDDYLDRVAQSYC